MRGQSRLRTPSDRPSAPERPSARLKPDAAAAPTMSSRHRSSRRHRRPTMRAALRIGAMRPRYVLKPPRPSSRCRGRGAASEGAGSRSSRSQITSFSLTARLIRPAPRVRSTGCSAPPAQHSLLLRGEPVEAINRRCSTACENLFAFRPIISTISLMPHSRESRARNTVAAFRHYSSSNSTMLVLMHHRSLLLALVRHPLPVDKLGTRVRPACCSQRRSTSSTSSAFLRSIAIPAYPLRHITSTEFVTLPRLPFAASMTLVRS